MTHSQLIASVLSVHAAVLAVTLGAYYKYSEHSASFAKSFDGMTATLRRIRRKIAAALAKQLQPVFDGARSDPSPIIDAHGGTYVERPINPVGSESYREAVREFIEGDDGALADYRLLLTARGRWCWWAKTRSWLILSLLFWQVVAASVLGILDRLFGVALPTWLVQWSLLPTATFVLTVLAQCTLIMRQDDIVLHMKEHYDAP